MMKIVHISTEAAENYAYVRLHYALLSKGVDSKFIVLGEKEDLKEVYVLQNDLYNKSMGVLRGKIEKYRLSKESFQYDSPFATGNTGYSLINHPLVQEADIIHIHWIRNILSISGIGELVKKGKKIVWTCHDSWAFTGGCYVRYGCTKYCRECGECPELYSNKRKDLSYKVLKKKRKHWANNDMTFIAPSDWMKRNIQESHLFNKNKVYVIPNALDTDIYYRKKYEKENKINLLFGAADAKVYYKGFEYLVQLLKKMMDQDADATQKYCLNFVGTDKIDNPILNLFECKFWGRIAKQKEMAEIYSKTDAFICPTLDDNLPGMVMESMACETPVVAFATGGVPEMIEHKVNGYIAEYKNAEDLLNGLEWILQNNREGIVGRKAREKVLSEYSFDTISNQHIELYKRMIQNEVKY